MRRDGFEALTNAVVGLAVSWLLLRFWLGYPGFQSAGITAVFFVVSTVRAFVIRRAFRGAENG